MDAENLTQSLNATKSLAEEVLNTSLPSIESVMELAKQINESIIPEDDVQEIIDNATNSRVIAEQALETAEMARYFTASTAVALCSCDGACWYHKTYM